LLFSIFLSHGLRLLSQATCAVCLAIHPAPADFPAIPPPHSGQHVESLVQLAYPLAPTGKLKRRLAAGTGCAPGAVRRHVLRRITCLLGYPAFHADQLMVASLAAECAPRVRAVTRLVMGIFEKVILDAEHARRNVKTGAGVVAVPAADTATGAGGGKVAWSATVAALAIGAFPQKMAHFVAVVALDFGLPVRLDLGGLGNRVSHVSCGSVMSELEQSIPWSHHGLCSC
jgi:hypothetical protein